MVYRDSTTISVDHMVGESAYDVMEKDWLKIFRTKSMAVELARSMAIRARQRGLEGIKGAFWVSEQGATIKHSNCFNFIDLSNIPKQVT
jgi:hypothetical protein